MKQSKKFSFIMLTIVIILLVSACGNSNTASSTTTKKEITIGYIPWDEAVAVTFLWKELLEGKGYKVKAVQSDVAPLFSGVAQGNIDLFLDVWMPTTHSSYMKRFGKQVDVLGTWYDQADSGLAVPDYVDAQSLAGLKNKKDEFNGKIISIEAGSGINGLTKDHAMPSYGLTDWNLVESSTAAMLSELDKAIANKEPIVVTLWRPHWAFEKYNLRYLKDPKHTMNPTGPEKIQSISKKTFKEDYPEAAKWLKDFSISADQLASLESEINSAKDETKGVKNWISKNKKVTESWVK
ncbi:glycine betaine ABC transporter substrate-binding protein [Priestia megaterium]|uniref:glycine betaine ABC transporter substrate-binding protein n=1 Tax=Priestia megaterium TaxID=1404 RepID=UPI00186803E8|nr:glycine betaine ABC transporter substrate-binding protein [Priestia megaterium]MBE2977064.1 glycine betaine ABC transporter substrate-binding protein [Priestia megaterium]